KAQAVEDKKALTAEDHMKILRSRDYRILPEGDTQRTYVWLQRITAGKNKAGVHEGELVERGLLTSGAVMVVQPVESSGSAHQAPEGSGRRDPARREGGSRDAGMDPVGLPLGYRLVVSGPRPFTGAGDESDLHLQQRSVVLDPPADHDIDNLARRVSSTWSRYDQVDPHRARPWFSYEVSSSGGIRFSGRDGADVLLSAGGWAAYGPDFIHVDTGMLMRGDSGWIAGIDNWHALRHTLAAPTHLHIPRLDGRILHMTPHPDPGAFRISRTDGMDTDTNAGPVTTAPLSGDHRGSSPLAVRVEAREESGTSSAGSHAVPPVRDAPGHAASQAAVSPRPLTAHRVEEDAEHRSDDVFAALVPDGVPQEGARPGPEGEFAAGGEAVRTGAGDVVGGGLGDVLRLSGRVWSKMSGDQRLTSPEYAAFTQAYTRLGGSPDRMGEIAVRFDEHAEDFTRLSEADQHVAAVAYVLLRGTTDEVDAAVARAHAAGVPVVEGEVAAEPAADAVRARPGVLSAGDRRALDAAEAFRGSVTAAEFARAERWAMTRVGADHMAFIDMRNPEGEERGRLIASFVTLVTHDYLTAGEAHAAELSLTLAKRYGTRRTTGSGGTLGGLPRARSTGGQQAGPSGTAGAHRRPDAGEDTWLRESGQSLPPVSFGASGSGPEAVAAAVAAGQGWRVGSVPGDGDCFMASFGQVLGPVDASGRVLSGRQVRAELAGALSAELGRPAGQRRLWPLIDGGVLPQWYGAWAARQSGIDPQSVGMSPQELNEHFLSQIGGVAGLDDSHRRAFAEQVALDGHWNSEVGDAIPQLAVVHWPVQLQYLNVVLPATGTPQQTPPVTIGQSGPVVHM
ncbi:hypothetical protein, partial [Streptomyces violaceorubidus]